MSFLTPLYALGILAVSLPIVFHLIQRKPKGEKTFSSLMFLKPSPPRLTRRSRLDHILLLILRGLALILLALAFARPFLRSFAQLGFDGNAQTVVILLDTSASMQREELWQQAVHKVAELCDELDERDRVALYRFDKTLESVVGFPAVGQQAQHLKTIRSVVETVMPSWQATHLDAAIMGACDLIAGDDQNRQREESDMAKIVLISDLQKGSQLAALNSFSWPENILLDCRLVRTKTPGNAFLTVLDTEEGSDEEQLRVRLQNTANSAVQQFELSWVDAANEPVGKKIALHVPSGQSRTVTLPSEPGSTQLALFNDPHEFDNSHYVAHPTPVERQLVMFESQPPPTNGLSYFLGRIDLNSRRRVVKFTSHDVSSDLVLSPRFIPMVVVSSELTSPAAGRLRRYVQEGGRLLAVLNDANNMPDDELVAWRTLTGIDTLQVEQADVDDYAMLTKIDFQHELFQPFADPRFNDFTKIRFWKHRRITTSHESPWQVLARFDNQAPALVQKEIGDGTIWILTSGWHSEDSQLALSSKFVPIIGLMFDLGDRTNEFDSYHTVGDVIDISAWQATSVTKPNLQVASIDDDPFSDTNEPGVYGFTTGTETRSVSVNLAVSESLTDPLDMTELEERGVKMGRQQSAQERQQKERQMRDIELESQQNIWRYLLIAVVIILGLETWIAGRSGRVTNDQTAGD